MKSLIILSVLLGIPYVSAETNQHLFPSGVEVLRSGNTLNFVVGGLIGDKRIKGYSPKNKGVGINKMVVRGRSPKNSEHYEYETALLLSLYVTKGPGIIYINDRSPILLQDEDVVIIPPKTRFAVEAVADSFEYITFTSPKWYSEQAHVVDTNLNKVSE